MKILHIVPSYKPAYVYGGPIESVSKLCEGLAKRGHEVDVYTTTANGETELDVPAGEAIDVDGVKVFYFKRVTKDPTHISPDLWSNLRKNVKSYDIVHIQSWWNILVLGAAWICYRKGVKIIISPRGMLSKYIFNSGRSKSKKFIHAAVGRKLLSKSWLHATAKSEFEECREIIPNWQGFIEPNILTLPSTMVPLSKNEVFTVLFMSRVHPKKGIEILLNAISLLDFPIKIQIAGSGDADYVETLKTLAERLNITSKIEWLGWLDRNDKFKALAKADLFALVSFNENFANVVVESLHVGTPVLVSHGVALSEFVAEEDLGWVTGLDVEEVAAKLSEVYLNIDKRSRINVTGREVIDARFNQDKLIDNYVRHYSDAMKIS